MTAPSTQADERARKNLTAILKSLAATGQNQLAQALGVSESTVSRMKDGEFAQTSKLLAMLELKVVPQEFECVDPEYLSGLEQFAQRYLEIAVARRSGRPAADAPTTLTFED